MLRRLALAVAIAGPIAALRAGQFQTARTIEVTLTEGTSMAAAVSPDRRFVAIDLVGALWILPFRGGEARKLTPDGLEARQPTWSFDNRLIAFQGYGDDGAWHVYTIGRDGSALRQVTSGPFDDREPAWSNDGTRVAFSSDRVGGMSTIWEVFLNTGALRQVSTRDGTMPSWTNNDAELTFASAGNPERGEPAGLWAVDGAGHERLLIDAAANGMPHAVGWSPNGVDVAYTVGPRLFVNGRPIESREDVFPFRPEWVGPTEFVYTADGQIKRRSLTGEAVAIRFTAKVSLQRTSYTIDHRPLDATDPQKLKGIVAPAVSPDGRAIAFVAMGDLWVLPTAEKSAPIQVTNDAAVELDPAWAPDSAKIAFSSDRGGRMDLWVRTLGTGEERQITDSGGVSGAAWSPDGNHIAYRVNRRELAVVTLRQDSHSFVSARGGVSTAHEIGRPTWAADSGAVAFGSLFPYARRYREGLNQILVRTSDREGDAAALIVAGHSAGDREYNGPAWSPDGYRVAYVNEGTLWTVPVDNAGAATGPPRAIVQPSEHPSSPSWEADSEHIVYQSPEGLRRVLSGGGFSTTIPVDLQWTAATGPSRVVVHARRVFDGAFEGLRPESDIIVEHGVIKEINPHNDDLHVGAVVDAGEETVMPGLIDMHAHADADYGERFGRVWLAWGVTTVRIPAINGYAGLELREAFDAGRRPGPRVFIAGEPFDGVRVYYPGGVSVTSDAQLAEELARDSSLGFDFFKTYVRLPDRFQKAVVTFAHAAGRPVTSHELYPAVAYGVDGVEHLRGTSRRGYSPKASQANRAYRDVIDLIAKSGMTLTPTIAIEGGFIARESGDRSLLRDARLGLYPRPVVSMLADLATRPASAELDAVLKPFEETIKAIAAGGGRILAGTDSPIVPYGLGLHAELESYVHAGLSPFQALQTTTLNAAQALGLENELGTIEAGKRADLVFVGGDPLQDIRNARDVRRVMRSGKIYTLNDLIPR